MSYAGSTDAATPSTSSNGGGATTHEDDIFMAPEHRQALREKRNLIVQNMVPDDILNKLQGERVLTSREVSKVADKGDLDSQNEFLLNLLMRKPDRAFNAFVAALRETDQNHIANVLDKNRPRPNTRGTPNVKSETPRNNKRRASAMSPDLGSPDHEDDDSRTESMQRRESLGVRVSADSVVADDFDEDVLDYVPQSTPKAKKSRKEILDEAIEIEIRQNALIELRNLRQINKSGPALTANQRMARNSHYQAIEKLLKFKKEICGVEEGSVLFLVKCPNPEAVEDIWTMFCSGELQRLLTEIYVTEELKTKFKVKDVRLRVEVNETDYREYKAKLLQQETERRVLQGSPCSNICSGEVHVCSPKKISCEEAIHYDVVWNLKQQHLNESAISDLNSSSLSRSSSGISSSSLTASETESENSSSTYFDENSCSPQVYGTADDTSPQ